MPFSFTNKSAGDLIRSQDWNAAMTAIAALYDKLNAVTGHKHTGAVEDGPQIPTGGIADLAIVTQKILDLAVTTQKLANLAVTNQKLAAGAVDITKMQVNSVGSPQIVDGSVTANELGPDAVTTVKILNGSVTYDKLAPGAVDEFGFAFSTLQDGQTAPVPSGFQRSECIYHWGIKYLALNYGAGGGHNVNTNVDPGTGLVRIGTYNIFSGFTGSSDPDLMAYAINILTIAKKGGW